MRLQITEHKYGGNIAVTDKILLFPTELLSVRQLRVTNDTFFCEHTIELVGSFPSDRILYHLTVDKVILKSNFNSSV